MDLHSKMTMYVTSKMTSPVIKTAKMSKWLRLESKKPGQIPVVLQLQFVQVFLTQTLQSLLIVASVCSGTLPSQQVPGRS